MADTITWTINGQGDNWIELKAAIVADSDGNVASPTETSSVPSSIWSVAKTIARVVFVPDSGDTQPTDAYDIALNLSSTVAVDALAGLGQNLSQTTSSMDMPVTSTNGAPVYLTGLPVASGSGYGDSNASTIYLLLLNANKVTAGR